MAKAVILINLKIPKVQEKLDTLYLANVFSFNKLLIIIIV